MLGDEITKGLLTELINSVKSGDEKRIEQAKYKALLDCSDLFELVSNYIFLNKLGIDFDFGTDVIGAGTKFYRIRKFEENVNFTDTAQWTAPPHKPQNRANRLGQEALYLGSTESICILEAHIGKGQKYVLATYEVLEDIHLGGYFTFSKKYSEHNIAGITLNAFLIAPSRNEINSNIFKFLDSRYGDLQPNDIRDWKNNFDLPFKFAVLNKRNEYYSLTNEICDILQKQNKDGIRYSSCYIPAETLGMSCSDYNVVLYTEGIKKIKFISSEIKVNEQKFIDLDLIKIVCDTSDKVKKELDNKS